jgi:ubiquinone/menaquinone biosynthesis C-methylase UbiE
MMTCCEPDSAKSGSRGRWLCLTLSLIATIGVLALLGVSMWTVVLAALFLACPVVMVGTYLMGQRPLPVPLGPAPQTRGATLDWIAPWYDVLCSAVGLGGRFRDRTLAFAALRPGEQVLDVGCGTGVLTRAAADAVGPSGAAWGVDAAPDMIRVAMQNAARTRNPAYFELAAVEALPFEDASFDVVLASLVLHHLPPDLKQSGLQQVCRVLKSDGRLIVIDIDQPKNWLVRLVLWPLRLHPNMAAQLQGWTAELLRSSGFASVTVLGQWAGTLTFWSARPSAPDRHDTRIGGCHIHA